MTNTDNSSVSPSTDQTNPDFQQSKPRSVFKGNLCELPIKHGFMVQAVSSTVGHRGRAAKVFCLFGGCVVLSIRTFSDSY